jgi:hypothetical protein
MNILLLLTYNYFFYVYIIVIKPVGVLSSLHIQRLLRSQLVRLWIEYLCFLKKLTVCFKTHHYYLYQIQIVS